MVARGEEMKGLWDNSEVQDLFLQVEEFKNKNKTLREAFSRHAQKYNRKPNSVRNYYYHEIDELGRNKTRVKSLGINLERHKKNTITYFSPTEEKELMGEIDKLVESGVSVRKACFMLSGGDVGQMLRFQNKYRNFKGKNKKPDKCSGLKQTENAFNKDNIIAFQKKPKLLSEGEMQALFMGLVRLVRRNVEAEGEEKFKAEIGKSNNLLRQALTRINSQEREIERLKAEYLRIKKQNQSLLQNQIVARCKKAEILAKAQEGEA